MEDHKIAVCSMDGLWLKGTVDDYGFCAKVCDEASGFGIDCGRVIKLYAQKDDGKEIFSYERGWDKRPRGAHKGVAQALVHFCESFRSRPSGERPSIRKCAASSSRTTLSWNTTKTETPIKTTF